MPLTVLLAGVTAALATSAAMAGASSDAAAAATDADAPALNATELLPLEPRTRRFAITDGSGAGEVVPLVLEAEEGNDASRWKLQLEGFNTLYLMQGDDGSILIDRLDVRTEAETLLYEPPVVLVPGQIVPDRTWESSGRVRVWDWEDERIQHRGEYRHRVLPVSREQFATPAGNFAGYLVEVEQTVDLEDPATIRLWFDCGLVPGQGLVKRSVKLVVDKPLWYGETTRRTVQLAE